jgi:hypothetical protein
LAARDHEKGITKNECGVHQVHLAKTAIVQQLGRQSTYSAIETTDHAEAGQQGDSRQTWGVEALGSLRRQSAPSAKGWNVMTDSRHPAATDVT